MDPASALIPHANPLLGYTMKLPASYRLAVSVADTQNAGHDVYTHRDEAADRALCVGELQNQSESPERVADFKVGVYSNANAVSPVAFAASPNRRMAFTSIQSTTIDGHAAARVVRHCVLRDRRERPPVRNRTADLRAADDAATALA